MMKKILAVLLTFSILTGTLFSFDEDVYAEDMAYLTAELNSGIVIEEHDSDIQMPCAGMVRLMSCLIFFESMASGRVKADENVKVSSLASKCTGTRVFIDSGTEYPFSSLLYASVMCSANDAVYALAEHISGTEEAFVSEMNKRAVELGLGAVFTDCTGLDEENAHMSAKDILLIAREIRKYPLFFQYSKVYMDTFTHNSGRVTEMVNGNRLVRTENINGMATSSSKKAGYCIAAVLDGGSADFLTVMLGCGSSDVRFRETLRMISYANANYTLKVFAEKGAKLGSVKIEKGWCESYPYYAAEDLKLLIVKGTENGIERSVEFFEELEAPLFAGDKVGVMKVKLADGTEYTVPAVLGEDIPVIDIGSSVSCILRIWIGIEEAA